MVTVDLTDRSGGCTRTREQIQEAIRDLYKCAIENPEKSFYVAYRAGAKNPNHYTSNDLAIMFGSVGEIPLNIIFENKFWKSVERFQHPEPHVFNVNDQLIPSPTRCAYIGRKSKWGNPHVMSDTMSRDDVCDAYDEGLGDDFRKEIYNELRGLNLICHCSPMRCHGDTLLLIANGAPTWTPEPVEVTMFLDKGEKNPDPEMSTLQNCEV